MDKSIIMMMLSFFLFFEKKNIYRKFKEASQLIVKKKIKKIKFDLLHHQFLLIWDLIVSFIVIKKHLIHLHHQVDEYQQQILVIDHLIIRLLYLL